MRILGVDASSTIIGLSYWEDRGRLKDTAAIRLPKGDDSSPLSWLEKMDYAADRIRDRSILWAPDVVAFEDVIFGVNAFSVVTLAKSWGYIVRVFREEYARAEMLNVNTATIRAALGLPSNAKKKDRQRAAREMWSGLGTQDEADACAVAFTAYSMIAKLRKEAGLAPV